MFKVSFYIVVLNGCNQQLKLLCHYGGYTSRYYLGLLSLFHRHMAGGSMVYNAVCTIIYYLKKDLNCICGVPQKNNYETMENSFRVIHHGSRPFSPTSPR